MKSPRKPTSKKKPAKKKPPARPAEEGDVTWTGKLKVGPATLEVSRTAAKRPLAKRAAAVKGANDEEDDA